MQNKFATIFAAAMFMAITTLSACGSTGDPNPCVGEGCPDASVDGTMTDSQRTDAWEWDMFEPDLTPFDPCASFQPTYNDITERRSQGGYWVCEEESVRSARWEFSNGIHPGLANPNRCTMEGDMRDGIGRPLRMLLYTDTIRTTYVEGVITEFSGTTITGDNWVCQFFG